MCLPAITMSCASPYSRNFSSGVISDTALPFNGARNAELISGVSGGFYRKSAPTPEHKTRDREKESIYLKSLHQLVSTKVHKGPKILGQARDGSKHGERPSLEKHADTILH